MIAATTQHDVFISSTILDLIDLRAEIKQILQNYGLRVKLSEFMDSDFEHSSQGTAIELCLKNVADSEYFILILSKRYGRPVGTSKGYSAIHMEFNKAVELKKNLIIFVRKSLLNAKYEDMRTNKQKSKAIADQYQVDIEMLEHIDDFLQDPETHKERFFIDFENSVELKDKLLPLFAEIRSSVFLESILQNHDAPIVNIILKDNMDKVSDYIIHRNMTISNLGLWPALNIVVRFTNESITCEEPCIGSLMGHSSDESSVTLDASPKRVDNIDSYDMYSYPIEVTIEYDVAGGFRVADIHRIKFKRTGKNHIPHISYLGKKIVGDARYCNMLKNA